MWRAGVMVAVAAAAGCHGGPSRCGRPARPPRVEVVRCDTASAVPPPTVVTELAPAAPKPPRPRLGLTTVRVPVPCLRAGAAEPAAPVAPACADATTGLPQVIVAVPVAGYPFAGGYPAAAAPAPGLTPDRVEAFTRRIEELEAQLRATRPAAATPAGGK